MSGFAICFSFRGQSYVASVYQSLDTPKSFIVYFTDVELILEFGSKVEYAPTGQLRIAKETDEQVVSSLQQALSESLKNAA